MGIAICCVCHVLVPIGTPNSIKEGSKVDHLEPDGNAKIRVSCFLTNFKAT